jgi:hypothetical protein
VWFRCFLRGVGFGDHHTTQFDGKEIAVAGRAANFFNRRATDSPLRVLYALLLFSVEHTLLRTGFYALCVITIPIAISCKKKLQKQ